MSRGTPATPQTELAKLLNNPHGDRIIELMSMIYDTSCFDPNPFEMARKCGNREVVDDLLLSVAELRRAERST